MIAIVGLCLASILLGWMAHANWSMCAVERKLQEAEDLLDEAEALRDKCREKP